MQHKVNTKGHQQELRQAVMPNHHFLSSEGRSNIFPSHYNNSFLAGTTQSLSKVKSHNRRNKKKSKNNLHAGMRTVVPESAASRLGHWSFFGSRNYKNHNRKEKSKHFVPSLKVNSFKSSSDSSPSFRSKDSSRYSGLVIESTTIFSNTLAGPGLAAMFTPPPSFPNNNIKPSFANSTVQNVTVIRGRMAELKCAVENLGTKSVSRKQ